MVGRVKRIGGGCGKKAFGERVVLGMRGREAPGKENRVMDAWICFAAIALFLGNACMSFFYFVNVCEIYACHIQDCFYNHFVVSRTRACLKIHSWHLHAPLRGIFVPNSLNVAHYAAFIWHKSPTKWHAQLPESNFQTRSKELSRNNFPYSLSFSPIALLKNQLHSPLCA